MGSILKAVAFIAFIATGSYLIAREVQAVAGEGVAIVVMAVLWIGAGALLAPVLDD